MKIKQYKKTIFSAGWIVASIFFLLSLYLTMALLYPQFKFWWSIPIVIMASCLILLNYHFLGDSLAGIALGVFLSYYGFIVLKGIIKI